MLFAQNMFCALPVQILIFECVSPTVLELNKDYLVHYL